MNTLNYCEIAGILVSEPKLVKNAQGEDCLFAIIHAGYSRKKALHVPVRFEGISARLVMRQAIQGSLLLVIGALCADAVEEAGGDERFAFYLEGIVVNVVERTPQIRTHQVH